MTMDSAPKKRPAFPLHLYEALPVEPFLKLIEGGKFVTRSGGRDER